MGVLSAAPTDPEQQYHQHVAALERRIADLERASGRIQAAAGLGTFTNHLAFGSTLTAGTGAFADWFSWGNATVPAWATRALYVVNLNYVTEITANGNIYNLKVVIGTVSGAVFPVAGQGSVGRFGFGDNGLLTLSGTGTQVVKFQSNRAAGTGQFQADTAGTTAAISIIWLP